MPQRSSRQSRPALILVTARLLIFTAVLAFLAGCSINIAELEKVATDGDLYESNAPITSQIDAGSNSFQQSSEPGAISVESIIMAGQQDVQGLGGTFRRYAAGNVQEVYLRRPVAVGGVDNILYIVDAELKLVFQYDLDTGLFLSPIIEIGNYITGDPGNIFVVKDHSFYIVDSSGKQVLHVAEDGTLLNRFQDLANLSRPVDVVVDELTGNVFVADGSFSHVLVFNSFGKAIRTIGRRGMGPGRLLAITALAVGSDGLYVFDRIGLKAQVFSWSGEFRYNFAEDEVSYPIAAVVDREERVYISDQADNVLRVYQDGALITSFGGAGSAPGHFRTASGLWLRNDRLYVADSLNRRIQVLKINPSASIPVEGAEGML